MGTKRPIDDPVANIHAGRRTEKFNSLAGKVGLPERDS
jgi:hypothetical protein